MFILFCSLIVGQKRGFGHDSRFVWTYCRAWHDLGAVVQQNTVLFDIMALIFVVGIGFFYALACGGDKWQRLESFGEASILVGTIGFFN